MVATSLDSPILYGLNQQQRDAVQHGQGPLLIIAGAGSGKTRTLVHRVTHLIERGTDPSQILLLTYTRRAAAEMLRRVQALQRTMSRAYPRDARLRTLQSHPPLG
jgi:DNA helicase-2/ATP-dependent DNA helicase PcrA